jgi:hypothetical protein
LHQNTSCLSAVTTTISYDDDTDDDKENHSICGSLLCSQAPISRKKPTLGSFIKDKSKEHLLNMIMHQADRKGLSITLAFPDRKKWIMKNLSIWFGEGSIIISLLLTSLPH